MAPPRGLIYNVAVFRIVSDIFVNDEPYFQIPGHTFLPTFPSFRPMGMVGEACLPSNGLGTMTTSTYHET